MSALPPRADIFRGGSDVRLVPKADMSLDPHLNGWRVGADAATSMEAQQPDSLSKCAAVSREQATQP